jgi:glycosyltransferase involved in cell wall biosynthesis
VLAFRNGAVPEVIDEGVTGHVVDSLEQAVCMLGRVLDLDRGRVRRRFEERFSVTRMAHDYLDVYRRLLGTSATRRDATEAPGRASKTNGASDAAH